MESTTKKERFFQKKQDEIKRNQNRFLLLFLIVFLSGYTLFFSSTLWLPMAGAEVSATKIGQSIEGNERKVTLRQWNYAEEQKEMEVILEIENQALDGIDQYVWSAVERKKGQLDVTPIVQQDDFVVLHFSTPRRWNAISLRMDLPKEAGRDITTIKLYTVKETVHRVTAISEQPPREYHKAVIEMKIASFQKKISAYKKKIREERELISEADERIEKLEEEMKFQTEKEILDTKEAVYTIETEKETAKNKIEEYQVDIKEYKNKIQKSKEKLKALGFEEGEPR